MEIYNKVVSQLDEFPTLPTIYSSLLDLMSNPRTTVNDLAKLIASDPASSIKILKTVNSSIFGLQAPVETISQAIFHVGFNEVQNLIMAMSIINIMTETRAALHFNIIDLWKHSLAVGVISRLLGKTLGIKNLENYYISGILHDVGKIFFLKNFTVEYSNAIKHVIEKNITIQEAENSVLGINHTQIGQMIADKWNLPVSIKNSINYHQAGLINGQFDTEVACIHLANIIARILELGYGGDNLIPIPNEKIWNNMNLSGDLFRKLLPKILEDYEQAIVILLL